MNTTNLQGSPVNFQELYMIILELIQNRHGHMEKWKVRNVKEFS